jgi:hypothetical protein
VREALSRLPSEEERDMYLVDHILGALGIADREDLEELVSKFYECVARRPPRAALRSTALFAVLYAVLCAAPVPLSLLGLGWCPTVALLWQILHTLSDARAFVLTRPDWRRSLAQRRPEPCAQRVAQRRYRAGQGFRGQPPGARRHAPPRHALSRPGGSDTRSLPARQGSAQRRALRQGRGGDVAEGEEARPPRYFCCAGPARRTLQHPSDAGRSVCRCAEREYWERLGRVVGEEKVALWTALEKGTRRSRPPARNRGMRAVFS